MDELKESLYVNAINNLMKKIEYMQLCSDFDSGVIDDEEFKRELTENEGQYLIKLDRPFDKPTFLAINSIVDQLEFGHFVLSDIEELFSIEDKAMYRYMIENNNMN